MDHHDESPRPKSAVKSIFIKDLNSKLLGCFFDGVYNWIDVFNKDRFGVYIKDII